MGDHLEVFLLGGVTLKLNGAPVPGLTSRKATALFVYLICHPGQSFSRDLLADLFYGHLAQPRATANLRVLLSRLRPLGDYLNVTRQGASFNAERSYWLDTLALEEGLAALAAQPATGDPLPPEAAETLEAALAPYRGDFLAGFFLPDAYGFEEWAVVERERLGRLAEAGLERLVRHYSAAGEYGAGLRAGTRLLELDPLHEAGHRHVMRMLARGGRPNQALAHYRTCCQVFADELGAEPSPETKALYGRIRDMAKGPAHNLPAFSTSFVGREEELAQIARRLQRPACRLLTLVGPGGMGKTRLAVEAARRQVSHFWGGAPRVKLLVTSRQRLNLSAEWATPIRGLPLPASAAEGDLAHSAAARLLVERGRQVRPGFTLSAEDRPAALRVCHLVGGMPLAIELAAGWLKVLSAADVAQEIERGLDFLTTSQPDVPKRQRDMRAVFEYSWRLLSEDERRAARRLAVFRGGFRREAAEAVLGDGGPGAGDQPGPAARDALALLSSLVDKSLLAVTPAGRYTKHPLLQQFAGEKLTAQPEELAQARERHGRYYAAFVQAREADLRSFRQTAAAQEIAEEFENTRAAWRWALSEQRVSEIRLCLEGLLKYAVHRTRLHEVKGLIEQTSDTLQQILDQRSQPTAVDIRQAQNRLCDREMRNARAYAAKGQALCAFYLGPLEQAEDLFEKSLDLSRQADLYFPTAFVLAMMVLTNLSKGRYEQATACAQEVMALAEVNEDEWMRSVALDCLGRCRQREEYAQAAAYFRESAAGFQRVGDLHAISSPLCQLGVISRLLGDVKKAKTVFEEGLAFARQIRDPASTVWFLAGLGELAFASEDYCQAQHYLRECLSIADEGDVYWEPVPDLASVADLAEALHDCPTAAEHFEKAVSLALAMGLPNRVLEPLVQLARLLVQQAETE